MSAAPDARTETIRQGIETTYYHATEAALAALASLDAELAALKKAAGPMARLPWPVSSDERDDWRVYQHRLRAVLAGEDDEAYRLRHTRFSARYSERVAAIEAADGGSTEGGEGHAQRGQLHPEIDVAKATAILYFEVGRRRYPPMRTPHRY